IAVESRILIEDVSFDRAAHCYCRGNALVVAATNQIVGPRSLTHFAHERVREDTVRDYEEALSGSDRRIRMPRMIEGGVLRAGRAEVLKRSVPEGHTGAVRTGRHDRVKGVVGRIQRIADQVIIANIGE